MMSAYRIKKKRPRTPPPEEAPSITEESPAASAPANAAAASRDAPPALGACSPAVGGGGGTGSSAPPRRAGGKIPEGWRESPKGGAALHGLCAIKTPLKAELCASLPAADWWTVSDALQACGGSAVGLWIDLTNTRRYYEPRELPQSVRYLKFQTAGHGLIEEQAMRQILHEISALRQARMNAAGADAVRRGLPSEEVAKAEKAASAAARVVVHCTHGLNRTGYVVATALCRLEPHIPLGEALAAFSEQRPPGLWREQYVRALHDTYGGAIPPLPPPPSWEHEGRK